MTPEHKVMIYQSLLRETEDAAVALLTSLARQDKAALTGLVEQSQNVPDDGKDPRSRILLRSVELLKGETEAFS